MNLPRLACFAVSAALGLSPALYASQQKPVVVHSLGTTSLQQARQRAATPQYATSGRPQEMLKPMPKPHFAGVPHAASPFVKDTGQAVEFPVVGPDKWQRGFTGLTSDDSREANVSGGTVEPPDQGLATNGSQVFETVNLALRIDSASGKAISEPISIASFFGVVFTNARLSDPRVFFDPQSKRFFFTVLEYFFNPTTGAFTGSNDLLAVSQTSDAAGSYFIYAIDGCPASNEACLADQPLIGVNDDGFYFSNNEFSSTGSFLEARIVALNKEALINNTPVTGVAYDVGTGTDFSIEPALPAPGAVTTRNNGTEYFTESLDNGPPANGTSLRIFALTNTESLEHGAPATNLVTSDFPTESYSAPVPANQKAGPRPLGQQLGEPEEALDTGDDRMLQLYYANNKLYTALNTELMDPDAAFRRSGAAWFVIDPETTHTTVTAHILHQGYIGIDNGSVMYPAFAANDWGEGVIGFSFSGTNHYPSTGYVHYYSNGTVEQKVRTAGAGQNPEDGFSGYMAFRAHGVARWGDYSSALVSPDGHLWFAGEYIPNTILYPRTQFTNWGTFISRVQ
ncbi:MAG: hypothetical protein ACR2JE_09160 [Acidobacteriaceae bacterium]